MLFGFLSPLTWNIYLATQPQVVTPAKRLKIIIYFKITTAQSKAQTLPSLVKNRRSGVVYVNWVAAKLCFAQSHFLNSYPDKSNLLLAFATTCDWLAGFTVAARDRLLFWVIWGIVPNMMGSWGFTPLGMDLGIWESHWLMLSVCILMPLWPFWREKNNIKA